MLIQQERQIVTPIEDDKLPANFAKNRQRSNGPDNNWRNFTTGHGKNLKICSFCNKSGHIVKVCFKKHGLPPYLKKHKVKNASAYTENLNNNEDIKEEASNSSPIFTADHHRDLLALLQPSSTTILVQVQQFHSSINTIPGILPTSQSLINPNCCFLDTRAIYHVRHCRSLFTKIFTICMIIVKLPNGHAITTDKCVTINLNNDLHLTHVLYIPQFFTNIISIPHITSSLNYNVHFTSTNCTIQVNHTQRTIITGDC